VEQGFADEFEGVNQRFVLLLRKVLVLGGLKLLHEVIHSFLVESRAINLEP